MNSDFDYLNIDSLWDPGSCEFDLISTDIEDVIANANWDVFPSLKGMKFDVKEGHLLSMTERNLQIFKKNNDSWGGSYLVGKSQFHIDDITNQLQ